MKTILEKLLMRDHRKTQTPTGPARTPRGEGDPNKSPLAISPDTRASQHAEGLTLLHIPSGQIFVCNRTAARIWQGATQGRCLDELSEEMSQQFHIGREVATKDTCSIVSQMELHGLIIRRGV
jgi:Coenzyme PQQ synthesis protein D (PqqD)